MEKIAAILGIISGFFFSVEIIGENRLNTLESWLNIFLKKLEKFFRYGAKIVLGQEHPDAMLIGPTPSNSIPLRISYLVSAILAILLAYFSYRLWFYIIPQKIIPKYFNMSWDYFQNEYWPWLLLAFFIYIIILNLTAFMFLRKRDKTNNDRRKNIKKYLLVFVDVIAAILLILCFLIAMFLFSGPYLFIAPLFVLIWIFIYLIVMLFKIRQKYNLSNIFKIFGTLFFIASAVVLIVNWIF